ncbi:hypothetical protein ACFYNY_23880 [Streptomyces sp. NPDC006530]|uniref:hypothetical protein n=1 Tax=Streptomyces sp. NPDC006530 TaxID=3364750 RepID=UPI0036B0035F
MTKNHARKEEVRRRMKENGRNSYQAELKAKAAEAGDAKSGGSGPQQRNADRREEFVLAVLDADLPQMVKVLLYELASRLDLSLSDWHENNTRVRFEEDRVHGRGVRRVVEVVAGQGGLSVHAGGVGHKGAATG